ncbi:MAG: penicillin acylase family protein [Acidobacteria bacterium]|nr:MAG: penicillin acylase family protein [Acidobacteriota bacterium]
MRLKWHFTNCYTLQMTKRSSWWRIPAAIVAVVAGLILMAVIGSGLALHASLPRLEGEVSIAGLGASVEVERDAAGVPTIRGSSRADVARALGFVHAQERFFQMDLQRRRASGEMAEIFGPQAAGWDMRVRAHRLSEVAQRAVEMEDSEGRILLHAYAEGVNAGLADLDERPFEYLVLRAQPRAWAPEDTILVVLSMFLRLNSWGGERELGLTTLADVLPPELFEFLVTRGTEFDAPMLGEAFETPAIPGPEVIDLRAAVSTDDSRNAPEDVPAPGSNGWALAGSRTRHGGAILASDMHLGLMVPNTWYRARLQWEGPSSGQVRDVTGVTLAGTPFIIAGSNGRVAWSFTNSFGDWVDIVAIEPLGHRAYRGPDGPAEYEQWTEVISVAGAAPIEAEFTRTLWGPVIGEDHHHRPVALRWTAHFPEAVGTGLRHLETAGDVSEAMDAAAMAGIPPQNLMVVDSSGSIGWTIAGRIPKRVGCGAAGKDAEAEDPCRWDGWLAAEEYPRILNPSSGQVWSANARVVDGAWLEILGDGGYMLGARAAQIRDGLTELAGGADEREMLELQLDDRAIFLQWWQELLVETLDSEAIADETRRAELLDVVTGWSGRAAIDDPGYRMVRAFRVYVRPLVLDPLFEACSEVEGPCGWEILGQREGPVRRLLTERPPHLLDPKFGSWHDLLLTATDRVIKDFSADGSLIADHPWGERNTVRIRHPLSSSLPGWVARSLDMAAVALPGDDHMPRVQSLSYGASERFVVSPGREAEGFFHMPCGQSGHPLSPHYRAGHLDWVEGRPSPFLPGPSEWRMELRPAPD